MRDVIQNQQESYIREMCRPDSNTSTIKRVLELRKVNKIQYNNFLL